MTYHKVKITAIADDMVLKFSLEPKPFPMEALDRIMFASTLFLLNLL